MGTRPPPVGHSANLTFVRGGLFGGCRVRRARRARAGAALDFLYLMSSSKRPSTSSLRRFITSRPYVPVAEIRRRFGIDDPDCMCRLERDGRAAFVGLPEREASKIQDLWSRGEIGLELSVEVHAPVVIGLYPLRIARYVIDGNGRDGNGHRPNTQGNVVSGPSAIPASSADPGLGDGPYGIAIPNPVGSTH